jgi:hypothetical protein
MKKLLPTATNPCHFLLASALLLLPFITAFRAPDEYDERDQYVTHYVVLAGQSSNFVALDATAKKLSEAAGIPYQNALVFDSIRGMIEPDDSDDEAFAGYYYPRRFAEARISIEMADYYIDGVYPEPSLRMAIVTGIFSGKTEAHEQLEQVKKIVPDAYIKKVGLYQGCMH